MTAQTILEQAKKLAPQERIWLAEELNASVLDDDDFVVTKEQIAELIKRREEHKKNPNEGVSWESIKAELRK